MRTLLVIVIGLVLAFAVERIAAKVNRRSGARRIDGGYWFIGLWLAFTLVDFAVGVAAGHGALLEMAIHALVFAVPAAVAWHLSRRRAA